MTPTMQLVSHVPEVGKFGDCARACIAALLDKDPTTVPHFGHDFPNADEFWKRINEYLKEQGYAIWTCVWEGEVEDVLAAMEHHNKGVYWMMGCASPRANHFVICCGGQIVCDPGGYPKTTKFTKDNTGYVWGNIIVPLRMTNL